jgi:hypothetical protein
MSVQRIIQESIEKNPLGLKEAFAEELSNRIRLALEAKMNDEEDEYFDEEVEQLDELSPELTNRYMQKSTTSIRDMKAKSRAHRTLGNDSEADRLKDKAKKRNLGFDKAAARNLASRGVIKKGGRPATKGDMIHKAAQKMPSSYYKEETEE